ncbi:MAG TPA: BlaI/MecI/CopY family transcriptional regulator [Pirellulales bacterium]|jgi:BlaI family penicillinase repressor|nr:BlaI/MecI/CopY family transcriptional regulator [Pirellulales bacterium]
MSRRGTASLGPLENAVMRVIWERQRATAEEVRIALAAMQPMKDSTVRTVLRRLEEKGYVTHSTDGRTYVYAPRIESRNVATAAVRGIIDRFCQGSVEDLLIGMVDDEIVSPRKLRELADRISRAESASKRKRNTKQG